MKGSFSFDCASNFCSYFVFYFIFLPHHYYLLVLNKNELFNLFCYLRALNVSLMSS